MCINIWGKPTSRYRSELKSSAKWPHVTCAHVALPPEVDRHREVGFPQIFMHKKRNTNFFFWVWVWVKKMHLGVSKYIFVDKVVVGHGVWLYAKRIGWKSQYTVFTVKIFSFFWGTWFKVPEQIILTAYRGPCIECWSSSCLSMRRPHQDGTVAVE